jgi:hypothetical protein
VSVAYEEIAPLALFGPCVAERTRDTGTAERTLYRRVIDFEAKRLGRLSGTSGVIFQQRLFARNTLGR